MMDNKYYGSSQAVQTMNNSTFQTQYPEDGTNKYFKTPRRRKPEATQRKVLQFRQPLETYMSRISCPPRKLFYEALLNQDEQRDVRKPNTNRSSRQNADNSNFQGDSFQNRNRSFGPLNNSRRQNPDRSNLQGDSSPQRNRTVCPINNSRRQNPDRSNLQGDSSPQRNRTVGPINQNLAAFAPHLKYGLFGKKRSKITKVQSRVFSMNQSAVPGFRQDIATDMPSPRNNIRQGQFPLPKPAHRLTKSRKKQLCVSDVMHLDIRPNVPKSPIYRYPANPVTKPLAAREPRAARSPQLESLAARQPRATRSPPLESRYYPKFTYNNRKSLPIIHRISSMEKTHSKSNIQYTIRAPKYNISSNHSYSKLAKRSYVRKGI